MPDEPAYTAEQVDAAMAALADPERLKHAQDVVAHAAPGLQRLLNQALEDGGYFTPLHEDAIAASALLPDDDERVAAMRTIVAEESRLGMFVGAAVGFELARELRRQTSTQGDDT